MPHGHCYLWDPRVLSLHIVSDALIALSYFCIPFALLAFCRKRKDLAFPQIFVLFSLFIITCGLTHLMEIVVIWHPLYWLSGVIKALTAVASVPTAALLVYLVPRALALPSPAALAEAKEKALMAERTARQTILGRISDGFATIEKSGRISYVNSAACALVKKSPAQLQGKILWEALPNISPEIRRSLEENRPLQYEKFIPEPVNEWFEVRCYPSEEGLSIFFSDIAQRKAAEETRLENVRLEEQRCRLEEASRMKSEFLANMSHELRTPLNGILGFSELLLDERPGPLNPKQTEYLGDVLTSGRHLLQLINTVLDLAKIEAGRMDLSLSEFSLSEVVAGVCAVLHPIAGKRHIQLEENIAPGLERVRLDEQKFKQVLYNLLSNAVKFSNEGDRVCVLADLLGHDTLRLRVIDTGIGIRADDIPKLFKEFQQLESGVGRHYEGTGLGLALTRRIVELHRGVISVESEQGKGSTFTVVLPLQAGGKYASAESQVYR
jgi:signal transduction histidine kinase